MTPEDITWPPPICGACAYDLHEYCIWLTGCECDSGECLPVPDDT